MNGKRGSTGEPLSGGGVGDAVASQTDDGRLVHVAPVAAGGRPSTRDMLVAAAIGVAGSLIIVPLTYLQVFAGIAHVYLVAATLGLWFLPCVVPFIVVRKPGASLIACLAMGVVSAATTPFGVAAIGALIMEGLLIELPFMVTLYRRWTRPQFVASAMLFSALMGTMAPRAVGVDSPTTPMVRPGMILKDTSSTACTFPFGESKCFFKFRASINASMLILLFPNCTGF